MTNWSNVIDKIIDRLGVRLISDMGIINAKIETVFSENPKAVKDKAVNFLVGKTLNGMAAEPTWIKQLIEERLNG